MSIAKIKEFNKRNAVYLNAIIGGINQSKYANLVSDIKYYKLSFGNQNEQKLDFACTPSFFVEKTTEEFTDEQPSDFLSYYWVTFKFENKTEYKIAMFYKDFDHVSGNIHVLPGLVQVFVKCDQDNVIDSYALWGERTSDIGLEYGFETPGDKCNGGRAYCEGSWHPCLGSSLLTRDCYTILRAEKCAECFGRELMINQENISNKDFYSKYCSRSVEAALIHTKELIKEIYPDEILYERRKHAKIGCGNGTYKLFRWLDLIEEENSFYVVNNDEATNISPLYSIVYIQDESAEGFYCVFGKNQNNKIYEYNEKKTSPNMVFENPDGKYHWEIKGKVLLNKNDVETTVQLSKKKFDREH
jgi:hypothetical protein